MSNEIPECTKCGAYYTEGCPCSRGPWNKSIKPNSFLPAKQNIVKSPAICYKCGASYIQDCICNRPQPFQGKKRERKEEKDDYHINRGIVDQQCLRLSRLIGSKFEPLLHDAEHIKMLCRMYGSVSDNLNHRRAKQMIDEFISEIDKVESVGWKEKK